MNKGKIILWLGVLLVVMAVYIKCGVADALVVSGGILSVYGTILIINKNDEKEDDETNKIQG